MAGEAKTVTPADSGSQGLNDIELTNHRSDANTVAHTEPVAHSLLAELAGSTEDLPRVTVAYKDVTVKVRVDPNSEIPTVVAPTINFFKHLPTCFRNKYTDFVRINNASGVLKPGSMTLVLSPPGHGKTSLLKAISSRIELSEGTVYFNGRTPAEAEKEGINVRKLTQYVDQVDAHLPLLTVFETLNFAHKVSSCFYNVDRVNSVIDMLGLEECRDTIIGNAMVRGVSGGQRRRVSIGEMLVGDARAIFLDEFSNGLDTATTEDIGRGLRDWARVSQGSIIATLQQPTPGMLDLFDDVILIRDANIVYQGPRADILPYLGSMGFQCPDDVDVCDFIIDCLSQPRVTIANQRNAVRKLKVKPVISLTSCLGFEITPSDVPCVTTDSMVEHFKNSEYWRRVEKEINQIFSKDKQQLMKENPLIPSEKAEVMYKLGYALPTFQLLGLVMWRQWSLTTRDKAMFMPRIVQAIFMGLLYGSLYWKPAEGNYFVRVAALVICVAQVAFGSMIELPAAVQMNRIAFKQIASKFFPPWMYIASNTLVTIPSTFAQTLILGVLIYFMNGAVYNGWNFIIFILLLIVQGVCLAVWFRMLSITSDDESTAQSIAGPSSGVLITFSGLFLSPTATPDWLIWIYWLSPFSWSVRALANNEFLHHRYDEINTEGKRLGNLFLEQLDMKIGEAWIGYAFAYMIGLSLFLIIIHSFGLTRPYYELSIGTRRMNEEEVVPDEEDDDEEDEEAVVVNRQGGGMQREMSASQLASTTSNVSSQHDSALRTLREKLTCIPTWLSFRDVSYTVQVIKDKVKSDRMLLRKINGYAEPGKLTALMGASGAGKTTLLDVLAGRKNSGLIEGSIKLNGRTPSKVDIANTTGYVEQFDSLLAYDTVRETLTFAARLRLPSSAPDEIKLRVVDEVMDILELTSIQDMIIGNTRIPGLSPSQTKRVNIGVELVANPAIIFLDEPTTGLDSRAAQTVMRVVRRIARSGRSVICTIHQPSAELFYLFDRLVLLAAGGYQMYFGNLGHRSKRFVKYLSAIEGVKPIPSRYNPASWMLEELGVGVQSVKKAAAEAEGRTYETVEDMIERFQSYYFNSSVYDYHKRKIVALDTLGEGELEQAYEASRLEQHVAAGNNDREESRRGSESDFRTAGDEANNGGGLQRQMSFSAYSKSVALPDYNAGLMIKGSAPHGVQCKEVIARHTRMYWRSPGLMFSRFVVVIFLSLLYGLIFRDMNITNQATAMSFVAAVSLSNNSGAITFGATSLSKMMDDRVTFYRERSSGFYQGFYWSIASICAEVPWVALAAFIGQIPSYFLVGLRLDAGAYFLFTLALFMQTLIYICNSMFFAAVSPSPVLAQVLQGVTFSLLFSFMGISIPYPQVPAGYKWLYQMLPLGHLNSMLIMPQLETCDDIPRCGNIIDVLVDGSSEFQKMHSSEFLADYLGWKFQDFWPQFGYVWIYAAVVLIISFVSTQYCDHSKR